MTRSNAGLAGRGVAARTRLALILTAGLAPILAAMLAAALPAPRMAQAGGAESLTDQMDRVHQRRAEDDSFGLRHGSVVVAPVPFSNPMIGTGLALGAGYLFKLDPEARTSVIGLGGMRSDNGSQAAGLMFNLAFGDNRWLVSSFYGKATLNYDLQTGVGCCRSARTARWAI